MWNMFGYPETVVPRYVLAAARHSERSSVDLIDCRPICVMPPVVISWRWSDEWLLMTWGYADKLTKPVAMATASRS